MTTGEINELLARLQVFILSELLNALPLPKVVDDFKEFIDGIRRTLEAA